MGKGRSRQQTISGRLAVLGASLFPLMLGLSLVATSWVESGVLRELGDAAMRSIPSGDNREGGRVIAIIGRVDPKATLVPNLGFVLGLTERLKIRQVPGGSNYRGFGLGRVWSYKEYDIERIYTPPFMLVLEEGMTPIVNRDYVIDDAPVLEGSNGDVLRYRGFQPGATILAIGTMTDHGFVARAVTDDSLSDYRQILQGRIAASRSWGYGWSALGSSFLAYLLLRRFGSRIRRGRPSDSSEQTSPREVRDRLHDSIQSLHLAPLPDRPQYGDHLSDRPRSAQQTTQES